MFVLNLASQSDVARVNGSIWSRYRKDGKTMPRPKAPSRLNQKLAPEYERPRRGFEEVPGRRVRLERQAGPRDKMTRDRG
jgi:hypothetical protein